MTSTIRQTDRPLRVLVADDEEDIRSLLTDVLTMHGYEVLTAGDGVQALDRFREYRPAFTLTDISMPGMTGLELLRQIKMINAEAAVILMTGGGSEAYAIEALRGGAINYFNKPVDINELVNTLGRYATLAAGYDFETYAGDFFDAERLRLELPNDIGLVNHAVQMIVNHCRAVFPLDDLFTVRFGLYEMIVNAIEHGNLAISYDEKSHALEENALSQLLRERAEQPSYVDRRVSVECEIAATGLTCTITDQGQGFDHSVYSGVKDPATLFEELGASLHGRGIMLTCLQFDDVKFNDKGNQVTILKRLRADND